MRWGLPAPSVKLKSNEMARLADGLGRWRGRSTGFNGSLQLTHTNLALKIQLLNSWCKVIVRLRVIVNTEAYDCVCFTLDSSPLLIAQNYHVVLVWWFSYGQWAYLFWWCSSHHHHNGVLLVGPWLCFAIKSCRHLAVSRFCGLDHQWVYTWGAPGAHSACINREYKCTRIHTTAHNIFVQVSAVH